MDAAAWDNGKISLKTENRNVLLFPILLIPRAICGQGLLFDTGKKHMQVHLSMWKYIKIYTLIPEAGMHYSMLKCCQ